VNAKIVKQTSSSGHGPVTYKILGPANAPVGARIHVDYSQAPIPEHFYVCDYLSVQNLDPRVLIVFGKLNTGGALRLRSKVEIYFPSHSFLGQFWKSAGDFDEKLRSYLAQKNLQSFKCPEVSEDVDKVQTFQANLAFAAQSGTDALMDFFYLSPTEVLLKAQAGYDMQLVALVRIILSIDLLSTFFDYCRPIVEELRVRYPEVEQENELAIK